MKGPWSGGPARRVQAGCDAPPSASRGPGRGLAVSEVLGFARRRHPHPTPLNSLRDTFCAHVSEARGAEGGAGVGKVLRAPRVEASCSCGPLLARQGCAPVTPTRARRGDLLSSPPRGGGDEGVAGEDACAPHVWRPPALGRPGLPAPAGLPSGSGRACGGLAPPLVSRRGGRGGDAGGLLRPRFKFFGVTSGASSVLGPELGGVGGEHLIPTGNHFFPADCLASRNKGPRVPNVCLFLRQVRNLIFRCVFKLALNLKNFFFPLKIPCEPNQMSLGQILTERSICYTWCRR